MYALLDTSPALLLRVGVSAATALSALRHILVTSRSRALCQMARNKYHWRGYRILSGGNAVGVLT